jgi:hypothetical protein
MPQITQLSSLTAVANGDILPIVDISDTAQSSAGSTKRATIGAISDAMGLASIAGGRLTLTSGDPLAPAVASGSTIYYTPFTSDVISLWDGTTWVPVTFTEASLALTATSGSMYDVFGYISGGALALESLVWTNTTTRATAYAINDGVITKSGDKTRRLLGSFYAISTNTTADSNSQRCLCNATNQVLKRALVSDTTSHTHTTTARAWNNTTTGTRFEYATCLPLNRPFVSLWADMTPGAAITGSVGLSLDASTMPATTPRLTSVGVRVAGSAGVIHNAGTNIGYHYLQVVEESSGSSTTFSSFVIDGQAWC